MLSEEEVRTLIALRVSAMCHSCNSHHISHVEGQIRGLMAVLTGEPPPTFNDAYEILDMAGIPYHKKAHSTFDWNEKWLKAHGINDDRGLLHHPKFESW